MRLAHRALMMLALLGAPACRNGDKTAGGHGAKNPADPPGAWTAARVAEIYFSTEVSGYVEPCGCTTKPLGGLQRLASVLARGSKDRVLVDAGDLLFPSTGLTDITRPQHLLKSRILARAYRMLGAVAINVAETDLSGGIDLLRDMQREGAMPFVSANVRPVGEAGPNIARSFVRSIGGIRVGFTGVATPERVAGIEGLTAIEYTPSLRAEVSALKKGGAEVIVVLAHVGDLGARELAKALPEVDIIVRAPGTSIERDPQAPERVGGVIIVEAGSQGQHIGRLTLALGPSTPERPIALDDQGQVEHRRRELTERKIKAYKMEIDAWIVDPTKAEAVRAKRAQIEKLEAELKEPIAAPRPASGPHVKVDLIRLTDDVPADPEMSRLLAAYYGQLREMNLEKGDASLCKQTDKAKPTFIGTERCVECHEEEYAFWKKTKHAKAWATLEEQGKHFDLTCIGCHTVGYQQAGGFCRLKDVGVLKNVGCESCHGPGSQHAIDKDASSIRLSVTEDTCKSACHVPDHSDAFVFAKYVREITGEGHDMSEKTK